MISTKGYIIYIVHCYIIHIISYVNLCISYIIFYVNVIYVKMYLEQKNFKKFTNSYSQKVKTRRTFSLDSRLTNGGHTHFRITSSTVLSRCLLTREWVISKREKRSQCFQWHHRHTYYINVCSYTYLFTHPLRMWDSKTSSVNISMYKYHLYVLPCVNFWIWNYYCIFFIRIRLWNNRSYIKINFNYNNFFCNNF